jgi:hypothetical protein
MLIQTFFTYFKYIMKAGRQARLSCCLVSIRGSGGVAVAIAPLEWVTFSDHRRTFPRPCARWQFSDGRASIRRANRGAGQEGF